MPIDGRHATSCCPSGQDLCPIAKGPASVSTASSDPGPRFPEVPDTAWGFTGAFLGLWAQDLGGDDVHADFDLATYREQ
ncbi:hypothetical protein OG598_07390 [Micromonospora sp. NBC_00330]